MQSLSGLSQSPNSSPLPDRGNIEGNLFSTSISSLPTAETGAAIQEEGEATQVLTIQHRLGSVAAREAAPFDDPERTQVISRQEINAIDKSPELTQPIRITNANDDPASTNPKGFGYSMRTQPQPSPQQAPRPQSGADFLAQQAQLDQQFGRQNYAPNAVGQVRSANGAIPGQQPPKVQQTKPPRRPTARQAEQADDDAFDWRDSVK